MFQRSWASAALIITLLLLALPGGSGCLIFDFAAQDEPSPEDIEQQDDTPTIEDTPSEPDIQRLVLPPPDTSESYTSLTHDWECTLGTGAAAVTYPFSFTLNIPDDLYSYYSGLERPSTPDYSVYVTHPADDEYLTALADELTATAIAQGFNAEETVAFVASFVQDPDAIAYALEGPEGEYPKYPLETLKEGEGDCEDSAILLASLLQLVGYDVVLVNFPALGEEVAGHMGLAVAGNFSGTYFPHEGSNYYYLETTDLWDIGDLPTDYSDREATLYELVPAPVLVFTYTKWTITSPGYGSDTVSLDITVRNWGTEGATDAYVRAQFEDLVWSLSEDFDLEPDCEAQDIPVSVIEIPATPSPLIIQLIHDQLVVDEIDLSWEDLHAAL